MVPEAGFNIHPWLNERADNLLLAGMRSFDADRRKELLDEWQEEWMHDPPIAEIYYPRVFEVMGSYVLGYDPTGTWFYDVSHLDINNTKFDEVLEFGNPTRWGVGNDALIYAVTEAVWSFNPMFMETYTEEQMGTLVYDTLYAWTLNYTDEQWLTAGVVEPSFEDYLIKPELAADYPTFLEGGKRVRVPLRQDVLWSDGAQFNATDVKFTFDALIFTPAAKNSGAGDLTAFIESVELVESATGVTDPYTGQENIEPYVIDFVLIEPHPDIVSILANDWGGSILPWHSLKDISPGSIKGDVSNTDWTQMLPGTGPFTVTDFVEDDHITLEKNNLHWGYGVGQGPYVSTFLMKWIPSAPSRLSALQTNAVDFGEYPVAAISEYYAMMTWDNVRVFQYDYPGSNGVWFNFDNRIISNRYVRQAIAHAIPRDWIVTNILTGWGIESAYPGKTHIMPINYYTDPNTGEAVLLFNEDLEPYEYSIAKATQYLNMWLYSQPAYAPPGSAEVDLGPVGDADFSGIVNLDDFLIWRENFGVAPSGWPWTPGQDVDPDFNNDNAVTMLDFDKWSLNYGKAYPFEGAR